MLDTELHSKKSHMNQLGFSYCKSWLNFWLMSVGTDGSSGRGPSASGGSIDPFWDRFVEVVPQLLQSWLLLFLGYLTARWVILVWGGITQSPQAL